MTSMRWDDFTAALGLTLHATASPCTLVISARDPAAPAYVQFSLWSGAVHAEVSDGFARPRRLLRRGVPSTLDADALAAAGWSPPSRDLPNWWRDEATQARSSCDELAARVIEVLHGELRVTDPGHLCYEAWRDESGDALELPSLGLTRA